MKELFDDDLSAYEAQYNAQKIAFAPIIFQATRALRDMGVLQALHEHEEGLDVAALSEQTGVSAYGLDVLLETGMSAGVVKRREGKWSLTKTGYFVLKDEMTNINFDYNHYVNYKALYHLDESIRAEKPIGLKEFGDWDTIYPGLSSLPPKVRESWFRFDHFYSDSALKAAEDEVLRSDPASLLEIGGNTGNFSTSLAMRHPGLAITVLDLPEQIALIDARLQETELAARITTVAADVLDPAPLPGRYDVIWMSQFLDCFAKSDIVRILQKARAALSEAGKVLIMEPLWDRQRFETSAFCIINTSPYFTVMANGRSKMYSYTDFQQCIEAAGLVIEGTVDHLGLCQSIIKCKAA